ncbi:MULTISPECIES: hypothetical protein [unclassified Streptomyces]|uniref:hypothetical protein n=1 Tax=unclassified Streptomyces TaxID=2593676 RepID=UPI0031BA5841
MYDLFGGRAGAAVDLGVRVESLLVRQVEGLEVDRQVQRHVHRLGQPEAVLLRGAFLCVVVTHERLPSAGDMSEFLSIEG